MANKYAGTKTEKNLWEAFAGESMARNKYTYFASAAKKAGYEQIAALFLATADNEKEHAKLWFKALGELGDTPANLLHAAEGGGHEPAPRVPGGFPLGRGGAPPRGSGAGARLRPGVRPDLVRAVRGDAPADGDKTEHGPQKDPVRADRGGKKNKFFALLNNSSLTLT